MNGNYILLAVAFAFFIMCPRMAGMCAVISKLSNTNPYVIVVFGGIIAIPLIALMIFLTIKFGVEAAILAAVATDLLAAIATGTFKLRYGIEIAVIALFIWIGVALAGKIAPVIEGLLTK